MPKEKASRFFLKRRDKEKLKRLQDSIPGLPWTRSRSKRSNQLSQTVAFHGNMCILIDTETKVSVALALSGTGAKKKELHYPGTRIIERRSCTPSFNQCFNCHRDIFLN
jgi:hypothetical protein